MGFWITVLVVVVGLTLVVWRIGRRRKTWQSTSIFEISRDTSANYGNIQVNGNHQQNHDGQGGL